MSGATTETTASPRKAPEGFPLLVPQLQAKRIDAAAHRDDRRAREHRLLIMGSPKAVVRDPRAEMVHVVVVGVPDRPGERVRELQEGAPLERGELEPPVARGLVIGPFVLVLDVEHPRPDGTTGDQGGALDRQEGLPPDQRAPAECPCGEREVGQHHAEQDPAGHAALRKAALEQEHEARPDEEHQQGVSVGAIAEPPPPRGALVLGERHRVDLARPAFVEIARVSVMEAVLALPPAVRGEEEESEDVAPAGVRRPRLEKGVVGEVVKERIHPHQEHRRDKAEANGKPRVGPQDRGEHPHPEVRQDDARDLAETAPSIDL